MFTFLNTEFLPHGNLTSFTRSIALQPSLASTRSRHRATKPDVLVRVRSGVGPESELISLRQQIRYFDTRGRPPRVDFKKGNPTQGKKQNGPVRLAVYRLAQEGFSMAGWEGLASVFPPTYLEAVSLNQRKIYEYLGAGYYSWGGTKIGFYLRARGAVGGILGILYSRKEFLDGMGPESAFLEKRLLPAFQALLMRLDSGRIPRPVHSGQRSSQSPNG